MSNPERYHELPEVVIEAVKTCDFAALAEFRETLTGSEVILASATLPVFDYMMAHMGEVSPEDQARMELLRESLRTAHMDKKLIDVVSELEINCHESFERRLKRESPAMYAMRKLMTGKEDTSTTEADLNVVTVGGNSYKLPEDVVLALRTLRPQFLTPLLNRIKEGYVIPTDQAVGMIDMLLDYTDDCYTPGDDEDSKHYLELKALLKSTSAGLHDGTKGIDAHQSGLLLTIVNRMINDLVESRYGDKFIISDGQGRGQSLVRLFEVRV